MNDVSTEMIEVAPMDDFVLVGGCHGLFWIPAAQVTDYYRAHGLVAAVGLLVLLLALTSLP